MNKYLPKLILLVKILIPVFITYLVFSYGFGENFNISNLFSASLTISPTRVGEGSLTPKTSEIEQSLPTESISPDVVPIQDSQKPEITKVNIQNPVDDILEKISILKQQIAELTPENNEISQDVQQNEPLPLPLPLPLPPISLPKINIISNSVNDISSNNSPVYPKILISEVQVAGLSDEKEEFVELYNPNTTEIDLTSWYLQKKTKTGSSYSTHAPNTLFSGKKILANGYFIIARENSSFANLSDIITNNSLTEDNSLILKNPNGEISDKLGFGQAQEYESNFTQNSENGQSIGRKWDAINNIEQDTNDNSADFELQNPTPKAQNITFVISTPPDLPPPTPTDTTAPEVTFSISPIQINEIQTAGVTVKDEFIELYNPNDIDINLESFELKKKVFPSGKESNLVSSGSFSGTILAHRFFLIVPPQNSDGTENYTGLATPDLRYSGTTFAIASNNTVLIYNKEGVLLDKVGFGTAQDFETMPIANPTTGKSIERKILGQDTDDNSADFIISDMPTPGQ